jgi:hypothetical protein
MKFITKKNIIIVIVLITIAVAAGFFINQYLTEKANKEEAIELAKTYNVRSYYDGEYVYINKNFDVSYQVNGVNAKKIMLNDPEIFKQLGWESKKVTEDVYYTTLSYRAANIEDIYRIAFQVNLNLKRCKLINKDPYLIDYYERHGYINENDILKTYDNQFE